MAIEGKIIPGQNVRQIWGQFKDMLSVNKKGKSSWIILILKYFSHNVVLTIKY